jgi:hypothetical protein
MARATDMVGPTVRSYSSSATPTPAPSSVGRRGSKLGEPSRNRSNRPGGSAGTRVTVGRTRAQASRRGGGAHSGRICA